MLGCVSAPISATADEADAAQLPPLSVAVFVTSRNDECYDNGSLTAIKRLARQAQDRINLGGGIAGGRLRLQFFDDQRDPQKTMANLRSAISDPQTVAMIGLSNSTRAKTAFDAEGKELKASGIPFISDISVGSIIAEYPNVFTTRPSEDEERMPVLTEFVKQMHIARPAFVGLQNSVGSSSLGDSLKKFLGSTALVSDPLLTVVDDRLDAGQVSGMIADLKAKNTDLVFLSVGSKRTKDVLKQFKDAGFTPPMFTTGRIESLTSDPGIPIQTTSINWHGTACRTSTTAGSANSLRIHRARMSGSSKAPKIPMRRGGKAASASPGTRTFHLMFLMPTTCGPSARAPSTLISSP